VVPSGEPQKKVAADYVTHLSSCTHLGARAVCEEWLPKVQQASQALGVAIDARKAGEATLALAWAEEAAAKRDYHRTIDKTLGFVRSVFPENRHKQDLAFPSFESSSRRRADEDDEGEGEQ